MSIAVLCGDISLKVVALKGREKLIFCNRQTGSFLFERDQKVMFGHQPNIFAYTKEWAHSFQRMAKRNNLAHYRLLFPSHWRGYQVVQNTREMEDKLTRFWLRK